MAINKMERRVSAGDEFGVKQTEVKVPFYYFALGDIFDPARLSVPPIIIDSPVGPMTTFSNMKVGDQPFGPEIMLEQGLYNVYIFCKTTPNSGLATLLVNPGTTGDFDFYSPVPNFTVQSFSVTIPITKKVLLNWTVTGKHTDSSGYDITIGEIVLSKYK
jgi:hypothetical protein